MGAIYLQHGRRHGPGGTDPIPGLNSDLPTAICQGFDNTTIGASSVHNITWDSVTINDTSVFSWTSGTNVNVLQTGLYMTWLMIAADSAWPASTDGYVQWAATTSGASTGLGGLQPFGAHSFIDVFAPSGYESGELVGSLVFQNVDGVPGYFLGHVDNTATTSFALSSPNYMVITRLAEAASLS